MDGWMRSAIFPIGYLYMRAIYDGTELDIQSALAITDKLKFWWSRYNGNLVFHVRYSKGQTVYQGDDIGLSGM